MAGPSTSQNLDIDFGERSFVDAHFKGEFMNAFLAARCIYEEHNLLTNKPPEKISSVSLAMAVEISKATINVFKKVLFQWKKNCFCSLKPIMKENLWMYVLLCF